MSRHLAAVAILVPDYDEAIAWYAGVLGFDLIEDTPLLPGKRWVRVAPKGAQTALLLARAATARQAAALGLDLAHARRDTGRAEVHDRRLVQARLAVGGHGGPYVAKTS